MMKVVMQKPALNLSVFKFLNQSNSTFGPRDIDMLDRQL